MAPLYEFLRDHPTAVQSIAFRVDGQGFADRDYPDPHGFLRT
jgi:hypothetical protein